MIGFVIRQLGQSRPTSLRDAPRCTKTIACQRASNFDQLLASKIYQECRLFSILEPVAVIAGFDDVAATG